MNSNCCGADILSPDSDGHGTCSDCKEHCVPEEDESMFTPPRPLKGVYIADLLNFAEQGSGVAYFEDQFGQAWKLQKIGEV